MTPVGIRQFHQTSWLTPGPKPFHDTKLFDSSLGSSTPCIVKNYVIFNTEPPETTICWYRFLLSESRGSRSYRHPWYIKLKCFIRIWGKLSTQNNYLQKLQPTPLIFHFYCLFIYLSCSPCIKFKSVIPFFWSCTLSPFKNIFIFKVYLHHIRYNIAVRNHLCCIECINGAQHLGENTNNFKNSFSNKCCHRSVSIWSKNSGDRDLKTCLISVIFEQNLEQLESNICTDDNETMKLPASARSHRKFQKIGVTTLPHLSTYIMQRSRSSGVFFCLAV